MDQSGAASGTIGPRRTRLVAPANLAPGADMIYCAVIRTSDQS